MAKLCVAENKTAFEPQPHDPLTSINFEAFAAALLLDNTAHGN